MGQSILGAQKANKKGSRAVSFGGGEEAEEGSSSALDLGVGFQIRDLVLSLLTLLYLVISPHTLYHQSPLTAIPTGQVP
jgi:hypothetical protein